MLSSYRRLQQYAVGISIISIFYNGAEGAVSIGFGSESSSRSLVFFGVQSGLEVISACLVVWRFRTIAKPGEERSVSLGPRELRIEKIASASIAGLLICLAIATEVTAILALVFHQEPDFSNSSLIISASALVLMILIWLPKRYLAKALNSSAMKGEATCSLSCIQITVVLFAGSLIRKLWGNGWWVDSATSLVLGMLFGWEGYKMIKWVRDPDFDGGCCKGCVPAAGEIAEAELGERYRDLCQCCAEKIECKNAEECKCVQNGDEEQNNRCCSPIDENGSKCCTHELIGGVRPQLPIRIDSISPQEVPECASNIPTSISTKVACNQGCCSKDSSGQ